MRNLQQFIVILFVIFIISCDKSDYSYTDEIQEGDIVFTIGTPQRVSENMILEVVKVTDNRCPIGIVCSTAGNVMVNFEVTVDNEILDFVFDYNKKNAVSLDTIKGHIVKIITITPHRYSYDEIINNYRITINVEKE